LDIVEKENRGHLLVIVNPNNATILSSIMKKQLEGTNEEKYFTTITEVVKNFENLDALYIPHYSVKKPNISEDEIEKLVALVKNRNRVLKEVTNSISAGIYISHGHKSIYGSDIQNWDDYIGYSKELPDLRLPVESYEQFCLLLEKDIATINTVLDKKTKDSLILEPFGTDEKVEIDIFNDINILFGSKGTGKTEILKSISKHYNESGYSTEVYESNLVNLDEEYDIKGKKFELKLDDYEIDDCKRELKYLRKITDKSITSIGKYYKYYSSEETNKISKMIRIKNCIPIDDSSAKRAEAEMSSVLKRISEFYSFLVSKAKIINKVIGDKLYEKILTGIKEALAKVKVEADSKYFEYKSVIFVNNLIQIINQEISKKTGKPDKPIKTGCHEYLSNRIQIEKCVNKIIDNIQKKIDYSDEYVGDLGQKGKIYCKTNLVIQNGGFTDGKYTTVTGVNKSPQKEVVRAINKIVKNIYTNKLFENIAELNSIDDVDEINGIKDLIQFYRCFMINNQEYRPSNGESAMILLFNELSDDKEIYLIDEPEKSLGNDYISEVIVPILKKLAQMGRRVIIATHDANIAVRTLPYNSIYREHDISKYNTYVGNPFMNKLISQNPLKSDLDWKNISMKTLEGGKEAFGERGKIYGNI
jgi:hypothetical protein